MLLPIVLTRPLLFRFSSLPPLVDVQRAIQVISLIDHDDDEDEVRNLFSIVRVM